MSFLLTSIFLLAGVLGVGKSFGRAQGGTDSLRGWRAIYLGMLTFLTSSR